LLQELETLIYTSFAGEGLKCRYSSGTPQVVLKTFEDIKYRFWDQYSPPAPNAIGTFLQQVSDTQILFGWVYCDRQDEHVRRVPYIQAHSIHLEVPSISSLDPIFLFLAKGPSINALASETIQPISLPDLWRYCPERSGVRVPDHFRDRCFEDFQNHKHVRLLLIQEFDEIREIKPDVRVYKADDEEPATPRWFFPGGLTIALAAGSALFFLGIGKPSATVAPPLAYSPSPLPSLIPDPSTPLLSNITPTHSARSHQSLREYLAEQPNNPSADEQIVTVTYTQRPNSETAKLTNALDTKLERDTKLKPKARAHNRKTVQSIPLSSNQLAEKVSLEAEYPEVAINRASLAIALAATSTPTLFEQKDSLRLPPELPPLISDEN
jgi:hypothetical protein